MTSSPSTGRRLSEQTLSRRLDALAELVRIGRTRLGQGEEPPSAQGQNEEAVAGFGPALLDDADAVLKRAGERLRLSGSHTVIALAGGTGSGKSTLFNALSGATFSPAGVTRPTTRHVHACVWGIQGAGPLLDWLNVQRRHRYARASVLDSGESDLDGLLLLDLPDHDSVVTASMAAVDRLAKLADMVIWVLDPQKYADAAVHNRYLIPLAGHASVFTVVLNQIDTLPPEQIRDCEQDLRRLLDAEGLTDTPVLPVSARTGEGLGDLRALLTQTVRRNRAATDRIAADIDGVIGGFEPYAGPQVAPDAAMVAAAVADLALAGPTARTLNYPLSAPTDDDDGPPESSVPPWELDEGQQAELAQPAPGRPPWEDALPEGAKRDGVDPGASVPPAPAGELAEAFTRAAGVTAMAQAMASARGAQAVRLTGWPAARLLRRRPGLPGLRAAGADASGPGTEAAGQAQQSEVDNAITAFAGSVGGELPVPWAGSLREAARSNAPMVPTALADAVRAVAAAGDPRPPAWWRVVALWQWLLTVVAAVAVVAAVVIAIDRLTGHHQGVLSEASLIPWLLALAAAVLVLGYLTSVGCRNMTVAAAEREREAAERSMRERVSDVTRDLVLQPAGRDITEYERFRQELAIAKVLSVFPRSPPGALSRCLLPRQSVAALPLSVRRQRRALWLAGGPLVQVAPEPGIAERTVRRTPSVRDNRFLGSSFDLGYL
jgi:GTP-binding protein EngB required for normal cell division